MADKFCNIPEGDKPNESLKNYNPGEEMAGKGYLKDWDADSFEDGYSNVANDQKEMGEVEVNKPRLMGEF